ncbi:oxidative damage protection protein [Hahella sp. KA22]|uniref:oxidative damage protection protein n=1 Tax=Hahella sp. KA22 TaxID=1628392 RepID=UPI000FDD7B71|nr:oxidative damage protection protein [Hahella sp. KA22]AZZ94050.1 oxidative damage protection protein [Hahella sp. KA22]QAY57424.1 oxidative damage protection protein [Hahella sp. KA22]
MARMVFCKKYQQELEGLALPPMPGARGKELFETVSKKAWQEWLQHQTMLINEKRLNLMDPDTRTYLTEQMEKFLNNENFDAAEGFVPKD